MHVRLDFTPVVSVVDGWDLGNLEAAMLWKRGRDAAAEALELGVVRQPVMSGDIHVIPTGGDNSSIASLAWLFPLLATVYVPLEAVSPLYFSPGVLLPEFRHTFCSCFGMEPCFVSLKILR